MRPPIRDSDVFVLAPGVGVGRDDDGAATIFDPRRGRYWRGNGSTSILLELLERPIVVSDAVSALASRYRLDPADVHDDVVEVLSDLVSAKLARRNPS